MNIILILIGLPGIRKITDLEFSPKGEMLLVSAEDYESTPKIICFDVIANVSSESEEFMKVKKIIEIPDFRMISSIHYYSETIILIGTNSHLIVMEDQNFNFKVRKIIYNLFSSKFLF